MSVSFNDLFIFCRLPYNQYFGGVSSLSKEQYLKINGFPNNYWGWGGEDDDIYNRYIFCFTCCSGLARVITNTSRTVFIHMSHVTWSTVYRSTAAPVSVFMCLKLLFDLNWQQICVVIHLHQLMNHHKNVHENYPHLKRTFLYGAKRKYVTYTNTWKIVYKIMKICLDNNNIFFKLLKNNSMLQINYYHLYYI